MKRMGWQLARGKDVPAAAGRTMPGRAVEFAPAASTA
jgi:hypothetical protein